MNLFFQWLQINKIKFIIFDSFLLLANIILLKYIKNNNILIFEIIIRLIVAGIMLSLVLIFTKFWFKFTEKYHFLFLNINILGLIQEKIFKFLTIIFLVFNILIFQLIWINENILKMIENIYFTFPWFIVINSSIYQYFLDKRENKIL